MYAPCESFAAGDRYAFRNACSCSAAFFSNTASSAVFAASLGNEKIGVRSCIDGDERSMRREGKGGGSSGALLDVVGAALPTTATTADVEATDDAPLDTEPHDAAPAAGSLPAHAHGEAAAGAAGHPMPVAMSTAASALRIKVVVASIAMCPLRRRTLSVQRRAIQAGTERRRA
jgi:hypothetical protein